MAEFSFDSQDAGTQQQQANTGQQQDTGSQQANGQQQTAQNQQQAGDGQQQQQSTTEPTWRDRVAGKDKAFLKTLERYTDEESFGRSYRALQQKLSSGELKPVSAFPDKGTDEEKSAWRQANGVPDKPDLYITNLKLPNGIVPGDSDKPGLDRLSRLAAQRNWSQDRYNEVVEAYYAEIDAATNARDEQDDIYHKQSDDQLRNEWGADYRRNVNAIENFVAGAPEELRDELMQARGYSGRMLWDNPGFLKWFGQVAMDANPAAAVLPPGMSQEGAKSRLEQLEAMVKDSNSDYYTSTRAPQLRKEYRDLLEAQERMQQRGRAA